MSRKYPALDIMMIFAEWNGKRWNEFLTKSLNNMSINEMAKARYGLQAGMSDLAKAHNGSVPDDITNWFLRAQRSLELTMKKILKIKHPIPNDTVLDKANHTLKSLEAKRKRDQEFEKFLMESAF